MKCVCKFNTVINYHPNFSRLGDNRLAAKIILKNTALPTFVKETYRFK